MLKLEDIKGMPKAPEGMYWVLWTNDSYYTEGVQYLYLYLVTDTPFMGTTIAHSHDGELVDGGFLDYLCRSAELTPAEKALCAELEVSFSLQRFTGTVSSAFHRVFFWITLQYNVQHEFSHLSYTLD